MGDQTVSWESLRLGSAEELEFRLSFLTPANAIRGIFIKGVLDVIHQLAGPAAEQHCMEVLGEKTVLDFFSYPMHAFLQMTYSAAHLLSGEHGGFERAMWKLGYQAVKNFQSSPMGKSMLMLAHGSVRSMFDTMPSVTQTMATGESTVRLTGPTSGIYSVKLDFMPPPYTEGALQALFEATKAQGLKVQARRTGPFDAEYEISWE